MQPIVDGENPLLSKLSYADPQCNLLFELGSCRLKKVDGVIEMTMSVTMRTIVVVQRKRKHGYRTSFRICLPEPVLFRKHREHPPGLLVFMLDVSCHELAWGLVLLGRSQLSAGVVVFLNVGGGACLTLAPFLVLEYLVLYATRVSRAPQLQTDFHG